MKQVSDRDSLEENVRRLFMQNMSQVPGDKFDTPVDAVIYGAPEPSGCVQGGTRIAVNIAGNHGFPAINIYGQENREAIIDILGLGDPALAI